MNPIAFWIGPIPVRWYGLSYSIGIMLAWQYARYLSHRRFGFSKERIDGFVTWGVIAVVIGGRLGHVIFYDWQAYRENLWEVLKIWHGGMSFHGGFCAVGIAMVIFCRMEGIRFWRYADCWACVAPIGIFFGRIANYINQELYGRVTEMPWGVVFRSVDGEMRHPSQLYEALGEGVCLFVFLNSMLWFSNATQRPGLITGAFLSAYSVARWICEYFREPIDVTPWASGLTLGQIYCVPMLICGIALIFRAFYNRADQIIWERE